MKTQMLFEIPADFTSKREIAFEVPAGFETRPLVSAVELAARYRALARGCDFDASERATRLLEAAKALEQGAALLVPEQDID